MADSGTKVVQSLYLRAQVTPVSIRNCILDQSRKPWYHDTMHEKKVKEGMAGCRDVIALSCDSFDGLPEVGLVLLQENKGYKLFNITPRDLGELGVGKYNKILQDFINKVVEPAAQVGGFDIDFSHGEYRYDYQ